MEETLKYKYSIKTRPNYNPSSSSPTTIRFLFYHSQCLVATALVTDGNGNRRALFLPYPSRSRLVQDSALTVAGDAGKLAVEEIDEIMRTLVGFGLPSSTWTQISADIFSAFAAGDGDRSSRESFQVSSEVGMNYGDIGGKSGNTDRSPENSGGGGGLIIVVISAVRCRVVNLSDGFLEESSERGARWVGAEPAAVEALEKVVYGFEGSDQRTKAEQCTICMEGFKVEAELRRMPCSHVYHGECIRKWLRVNHVCPLCRFALAH